MKRFSKTIVVLLITLSLVLLASCGKKDKDNGNSNGNQGTFPGGNINTEGGLEGPIIPWD